MQEKYKKIGISGGTFDPIHHGHLIIAEQIRESLDLDRIVFIPSGMPPHKANLKVSSAEHRYNMVFNAIKTNPHFEVSRIEIEREGFTYTVDTLTRLNEVYNKDAKMFFITGADVIPDLLTWKDYERIFSLCDFIAVLRPGYKKDNFIQKIEYLKVAHSAKIHIVDAPLIGISSTIIRERVRNGKSIKYLVPESVEKYIYENGLYKLEV